MSAPIISVENLSKRYLVGHRAERPGAYNYTALRDVLGRELRNAARKAVDVVRGRQVVPGNEVEEFWALKDVSFEVKQGEVLGIIGSNGAGKSTLLKILSRITEPTAGRVTLRGRVASLLEVGTGFHPELTGRENIYLNGAILGMTRAEIRKKFDEIVAFAEVEKFLDTPVKRYSSGMYVRLAFAVAAHLEPEILIVDEVLAVGDAEFQKKCLGKMDEVSRREGRTVLFVSHNMAAVRNLCGRSVLLKEGSLYFHGDTAEVVETYTRRPRIEDNSANFGRNRPVWASEYITHVRLLNERGSECQDFGLGESIVVEANFAGPKSLRSPVLGIVIHHKLRGIISNVNTRMTGYWVPPSKYRAGAYRCNFPCPPFVQGEYYIDIWLADGHRDVDMIPAACEFSIHEKDIYHTGQTPFGNSLVFLKPSWSFERRTSIENCPKEVSTETKA